MNELQEEKVDFRDIEGFPGLFKVFTSDFHRVASFFPGNPAGDTDLQDIAAARLENSYPREKLGEILLRQNRRYHPHPAVEESIRHFVNTPDTPVVFTGQQPGLLTGPLLTIYKTLTTIALCTHLEDILGKKVIPFFWMQNEDHNPEEVSTMTVRTAEGLQPYSLASRLSAPERTAVGSISLDRAFPELLAFCRDMFEDAPHGKEALEHISRAASSEQTISGFFGFLMSRIFGRFGLVLVDSLDPALKALAAPVLQQIFTSRPAIDEAMTRHEEALRQAGFEPRVTREDGHSLIMHYGAAGRAALFLRGDRAWTRDSEEGMSSEEISRMMEKSPERFGPNVLSRPLVQDFLFPTLAYVAGPSEIAYFAQLAPLYRCCGIPMPLVYPRAGFTLVDKVAKRALDALGLDPVDCIKTVDFLDRWRKEKNRAVLDEDCFFKGKEELIQKSLDDLVHCALKIDRGGEKQVLKIKNSILYQLSKLQERAVSSLSSSEETVNRRLDILGQTLRPEGQLQERVLNFFQFYAAYGEDLLPLLLGKIAFGDFRHIILPV